MSGIIEITGSNCKPRVIVGPRDRRISTNTVSSEHSSHPPVAPSGKRFTSKDDMVIRRMFGERLPTSEISREVGFSVGAVSSRLDKLGLDKALISQAAQRKSRRAKIARLLCEGLTIREIMRQTGMGYSTICSVKKEENGLDEKKEWSKEDLRFIMSSFREGAPVEDMAIALCRSYTSVALKVHYLKRRREM